MPDGKAMIREFKAGDVFWSDAQTHIGENIGEFYVCSLSCRSLIYKGMFLAEHIDEFYPDLAARRLVYTAPVRDEEAGGSLLRVRKFIERKDNSFSVIVGGRPAKAGIDPDNKLVDRKPDDNMVPVEVAP